MFLFSFFYPFFFFNATPPTEIYTLSLHDALPISSRPRPSTITCRRCCRSSACARAGRLRSEEHTSELQSLRHLVCRLLLEKKKKKKKEQLNVVESSACTTTQSRHYSQNPESAE